MRKTELRFPPPQTVFMLQKPEIISNYQGGAARACVFFISSLSS